MRIRCLLRAASTISLVPIGELCYRIGKIGSITDCKTKWICEKPAVDVTNPKLYKCDADYEIKYKALGYTSEVSEEWKKIDQLNFKDDLDGDWVMVKYVTCNGEGFTVYLEDNQKFDKFVQRIQCGRPECESDVKLMEPTARDMPARVHCDFNDSYKEYTCNVRANWYWHVNGKKHEDQFMDAIFCDNIFSEWVGSGESSVEVKFDTGSNVVCMKTAGSTVIPLTGLALILMTAFQ